MKTALLQIESGATQEENFEIAKNAVTEAAQNGADVMLLPELWNIGYTAPDDYPGGADAWRGAALSESDERFIRYQKLAAELGVAILLPYLERDAENHLYNTAALIDRHGEIALRYRKAHLVHVNWEKDVLTAGDEFPVAELDTKDGPVKVGVMICYDREFPEAARLLMLHGAEIVLVPNACYLDRNRLDQFRARGFENMMGVAMTNYPMGRGNFNGHSVAYDGMREKGVDYDATIVTADENEGIWYADLDMRKLRDYRAREQWGDRYRRPEIYKDLVV